MWSILTNFKRFQWCGRSGISASLTIYASIKYRASTEVPGELDLTTELFGKLRKEYNRASEYSIGFLLLSYVCLRVSLYLTGAMLSTMGFFWLSLAVAFVLFLINFRLERDFHFIRAVFSAKVKRDKFEYGFNLFIRLLFYETFLVLGGVLIALGDPFSANPKRHQVVIALSYMSIPAAAIVLPRLIAVFRLMREGWREI